MPKPSRTAKYMWRMAADPPLCGPGRTVERILQCPLPRRGETCRCLFEINEVADDLAEAGAADVAGWFDDEVDPDDVPQLMKDLRRARVGVSQLRSDEQVREQLAQRLDAWIGRFADLEAAGAGLTGRYSDDLDL
jgi:hypothetical protein